MESAEPFGLLVGGVRVMPGARVAPGALSMMWPAMLRTGEYIAVLFRVRVTGLTLCMLKVLRVSTRARALGAIRMNVVHADEVSRGGKFGFCMWHVPSGRTLTSRAVLARADNWSVEDFELKAPNMRRLFDPFPFTITAPTHSY